MLINAFNPKVALFFLAFIPQFIDSGSPHKPLIFLLLGLIFNFNSTLLLIFIAWLVARAKSGLTVLQGHGRRINQILGLGFVGLGVKLAFER